MPEARLAGRPGPRPARAAAPRPRRPPELRGHAGVQAGAERAWPGRTTGPGTPPELRGRAGSPGRLLTVVLRAGDLILPAGDLIGGADLVRRAAQALLHRLENRQALADEAGRALAEAVRAVQHAQVRARQAAGRLPHDLRELLD